MKSANRGRANPKANHEAKTKKPASKAKKSAANPKAKAKKSAANPKAKAKKPASKAKKSASKAKKSASAPTASAKVKKPATKASARKEPLLYLDNNGTTLICKSAASAYSAWLSCYNPAAGSSASKGAADMISRAKLFIQTLCNAKNYEVIFTSGASESNCYILRSTVSAYARFRQVKPHLVVGAAEHSASLKCCQNMAECGIADVTYVQPNIYGVVSASSVAAEIRDTTCLVSIMYANNEIGAVSNIPRIAAAAHERKVPFHSDCVQMFGRYKLNLEKSGIDAISASFHKLYGPKGIGLLVIKKTLIDGYKLTAQISGSQQNGLRGGTENVPAIASALAAMKWNFKSRSSKNKKLESLCDKTILMLSKHMPIGNYKNYVESDAKIDAQPVAPDMSGPPVVAPARIRPFELVILGPDRAKTGYHIPNTLLIAFAWNAGDFCNVKFKKELARMGIIVSISSACLTASASASHVLTAIRAPKVIKTGVIRISFSDYNSASDATRFCRACIKILSKWNILPI